MNWKSGIAALGGAVLGGVAGFAVTRYATRGKRETEGTGALVGAALGMIVGASIPSSSAPAKS